MRIWRLPGQRPRLRLWKPRAPPKSSTAPISAAAATGRLVLTADLNVRLLEPARRQAITATGRIIRAGRTSVVCEMTARAEDGRRVAVGTGAFAITKQPLPDG